MSLLSSTTPGGLLRPTFVLAHFVSFIFLFMTSGLLWYLGNLIVYLNSYWYAHNMDTQYQAPWIMAAFLAFWPGSQILAGYLITIVDDRIILFIGVLLYDGGIFLSRLSVEHSMVATVFTLGVMTGAGLGFLDMEALTRVPKLVKTRIGLSLAILHSYSGIGAIFINVIITWYTNSNNKHPDINIGHMKIFSEKSVIERVPSLFIVLGTVISAFHLLGLCLSFLLRVDHNTKLDQFTENPQQTESEICSVHLSLPVEGKCTNKCPENNFVQENGVLDLPEEATHYYDSTFDEDKDETTSLLSKSQTKQRKFNDHNLDNGRNDKNNDKVMRLSDGKASYVESRLNVDLPPRQVLKTWAFYAIWFSSFACEGAFIVVGNYYKVFGILWIADDHFLTNVAVVSLFLINVFRPLWGIISDKLTVKTSQIIITSILSLCCLFYFFTPQINRWLFAVCTCIMFCLTSFTYLNIKLATYKLFGKSYVGINYGLVSSLNLILNPISPLFFSSVLHHFGWFAVFGGAGVINTLALLATYFAL